MKINKIIFIVLVNILCNTLFAQQKDFEGIVYYNVEVKSKAEGLTDKYMKTILGTGDQMTAYIKQGNYRQSSSVSEAYYIHKNQKLYFKFRKIDTLFYLDYSSDTSRVLKMSKPDEKRTIAGFDCKVIIIQTGSSLKKYFYAPALHKNPEFDVNNKIDGFNIYAKETESIWLALYEEAKSYSLSLNCTRLEQKTIDNSVFELPKLPERKFTLEAVRKEPEFIRSGGWIKYLQTNLNSSLGAKYIKIPKKDSVARQIVQVSFLISERGEVLNVKVLNKNEVHSKLAEEAVRVISESHGWRPATMYGEKIDFLLKQPITFEVSKQ